MRDRATCKVQSIRPDATLAHRYARRRLTVGLSSFDPLTRIVIVTLIDPRIALNLRALVLDVDGVLTDGGLYYGADGEALKRFHVHDGHGIKRVRDNGIDVWIVSGRSGGALHRRCQDLGIEVIRSGVNNKLAATEELLHRFALSWASLAVMGDDEPDVPLLQRAALAAAPVNAHPCALNVAQWQGRLAGGQGAVRELCDAILSARLGTKP